MTRKQAPRTNLDVAALLLERYLSFDATIKEDLPELSITPKQAQAALKELRSLAESGVGEF